MDIKDIQKAKSLLEKKSEKKPKPSLDKLIQETAELDTKPVKEKRASKEDLAQIELDQMVSYDSTEFKNEEPEEAEVIKSDSEWDVPIDQPVTYFDPELSYELTGYRPITATKGLDFDPKLFTVAADTYRKNGRYTDFIPGTFKHRNHWKEEFDKCLNGVTIGKYRITGEHYFFLNYYRLLSVLGVKDGTEVRSEDFPGFFTKQYEYFHYIELARKAGYDVCVFKCRGIGFSEMIASNLAHGYTFHKATKSIVAASKQSYVDSTLAKTWQELDFLNTGTEGGFRRVRMKIDTAVRKRASKVDSDKNESGWMSEIEGVVVDNPRKLRGARVYNLCIDEAGSFPNLVETYIQARALVDILGYRIGQICLGGTGGDQGPQLAGLKQIFYNPEEFQVLPYKNTYAANGQVSFTGFFIPSYEMWFGTKDNPGFDSRGVVDSERARAFYKNKWAKITDPKHLIRDRAEFCFTPEDAFVLEGSNQFDQERLTDQLAALTIHNVVEKPKHIKLHWQLNGEGTADRTKRPNVEYVTDGPVQIVEMPMLDDAGVPYTNLYIAGTDGVDLDSSTSTGQTDVSNFCMVIMRRQLGTKSPKVVAIYKDRPKHIQTAFDTALQLCMFYNCKMLVEATRISIKQYFEKEHKLDFMLRRPKATANAWGKTNFKQFGVPATEPIIKHQLDLIEQYIVDYCEEIQFPDLLDELIRYSYENKRKFDEVAAFGLTLLADEDYIGKLARVSGAAMKHLSFGYFKDDNGQIAITSYDENSKPRTPGEAPFKLFV